MIFLLKTIIGISGLFGVAFFLSSCGNISAKNPFASGLMDSAGVPDPEEPNVEPDESKLIATSEVFKGTAPVRSFIAATFDTENREEDIAKSPKKKALLLPRHFEDESLRKKSAFSHLFRPPAFFDPSGQEIEFEKTTTLKLWLENKEDTKAYLLEGFSTNFHTLQIQYYFRDEGLKSYPEYENFQGADFGIFARGVEGSMKGIPYFVLSLGQAWNDIFQQDDVRLDFEKKYNDKTFDPVTDQWSALIFADNNKNVDANNAKFMSLFFPESVPQRKLAGYELEDQSISLKHLGGSTLYRHMDPINDGKHSQFSVIDQYGGGIQLDFASSGSVKVLPFDYGLMIRRQRLVLRNLDNSFDFDQDFNHIRADNVLTATTLGMLSPSQGGTTSYAGNYHGRTEADYIINSNKPYLISQRDAGYRGSSFRDSKLYAKVGQVSLGIAGDKTVDDVSLWVQAPLIRKFEETESEKDKKIPIAFPTGGVSYETVLKFTNKGTSMLDDSTEGWPFSIAITPDFSADFVQNTLGTTMSVDNSDLAGGRGVLSGAFYGPNREVLAGVWSYHSVLKQDHTDVDFNHALTGVFAIKLDKAP